MPSQPSQSDGLPLMEQNRDCRVTHEHDWQAHGLTERTVELDGGFVRARRTFAVQSCACGEVRELFVSERRWRPYV